MRFSIGSASFILTVVIFARALPNNVVTTVGTNETGIVTSASNATGTVYPTVTSSGNNNTLTVYPPPTATVNVTCDPAAPTLTTTYDSFTITFQECTVTATSAFNATGTVYPTVVTSHGSNNTLTVSLPTATVNATCDPAAPTKTNNYANFTNTYQGLNGTPLGQKAW
ncbi:hypothetical protein MPER_01097 [Moniliophthora perniciosa FA553]|nr:hypothetical protein MPER_01097 [Moniliophthora perniciosa FA553]